MAGPCDGSCGLCIESIDTSSGLTWDGETLGYAATSLAAALLSTDACQVLSLGSDGKLFTRERAAGWVQSSISAPQTFGAAAIPANNAVVVSQSLTVTNPSACQSAVVDVSIRLPSVVATVTGTNHWRLAVTAARPSVTLAPAALPITTAATSLFQPERVLSVDDTPLILAPGASTVLSMQIVFQRISFTANAGLSLKLGRAGIRADGRFTTP